MSGSPIGVRVSASQIRTVLSSLPVARRCPSGLYATLLTDIVVAAQRLADWAWPVSASQIRTVLSALAEAMRRPSGLNATQVIQSSCPVSGAPTG